jgi:hypothetical protein
MHPEVFVTDQEDALINAASEAFPSTSHFLCIWNLNKNIFKNCRHFFSTGDEYNIFFDDWKDTMYSLLEQDFEANYQHFKYKWAAFPKAILYIDRNLYPLRRKFALAWTNQLRHFGCTSTSRVEGIHFQIKKYVVSSRQDLLGVCMALKLSVETQLNEIKIMVEEQKIFSYYRFGELFSNV